MIKAIIFDFGRVISAQKPLSLFHRYEDELGLEPGTINSVMFDSQAWQKALVGRKTVEEFWYEIGPELGLNSREEIDAFRNRYWADENINTNVLKLIQKLHGHYRLAVLSNAPPGLSQWLADWRILDLFDLVFCSGDEGVVKPDAMPFEVTLEKLGVQPGEAVFIDDTTENVEAARKLGLHGILFTTAEELEKELNLLLSKDY
jgi:epoxide hydrolase-like predicted phosphatase